MASNPDVLMIPTRVRVVSDDEVERLEQRRKEREQELQLAGWTPRYGWLASSQGPPTVAAP